MARATSRGRGAKLRCGILHFVDLRLEALAVCGMNGHVSMCRPETAEVPVPEPGAADAVREDDDGKWSSLGGVVDADEKPVEIAIRDARARHGHLPGRACSRERGPVKVKT